MSSYAMWLPLKREDELSSVAHLMDWNGSGWESLCGRVYRKTVNVSRAVRYQDIDQVVVCALCKEKVVDEEVVA